MPAPSIPKSSITIFVQSTAPVGWTKLTTLDDYGLRVVSGTAGQAGATAFSTCFTPKSLTGTVSAAGSIGAYTLSTDDVAAHTHNPFVGGVAYAFTGRTPIGPLAPPTDRTTMLGPGAGPINTPVGPLQATIAPAGGSLSHNHTVPGFGISPITFSAQTLSLRYVDVIQCQRN